MPPRSLISSRYARIVTILLAATLLSSGYLFAQSLPPGNSPAPGSPGSPGFPGSSITAGGTQGIDAATGRLPTFTDLYATSPIINSVILAVSILSLCLFLFFYFTIHRETFMPAGFIDDVNKLVTRKEYDQAAALCRTRPRVFCASIIQRCLENAGKEHSVILDMIDSEGRRRADIVWNRLSYLADVINVAPMLGLLGTVVGMIKAFYLFESQAISARSIALSRAIGEAMSTTMFGLIVAIVSLVFYTIIKARVTRVLADTEQAVHSIADHVKRGN